MATATILIIDDEVQICRLLAKVITRMGYEALTAYTLGSGMQAFRRQNIDVVLLDVYLPDGNGIDALPEICSGDDPPEAIIITGYGDPDGAELALTSGAWDYLQKPVSAQKVKLVIERALQFRNKKKNENIIFYGNRIVGGSKAIRQCLNQLAQAAKTDINVLITGETGTGKELFARVIHHNSIREKNNFVVLDCSSLPEHLIEGILFGYERGAFTGAEKASSGLIKQAEAGTLFLDEIGEMPFSLQKKLLRVLQERKFRPLGSQQEIQSNFRLIAVTNRDLSAMVASGLFREDLFYRLNAFTLHLPPLRERKEDIRDLVVFHTERICQQYGLGMKGFSNEYIEALVQYDWPGNVRELANIVERSITVGRDEQDLFIDHLPVALRAGNIRSAMPADNADGITMPAGNMKSDDALPTLNSARTESERRYLQALTQLTGRDIAAACKTAGISRSRLYALLKKHRLTPP